MVVFAKIKLDEVVDPEDFAYYLYEKLEDSFESVSVECVEDANEGLEELLQWMQEEKEIDSKAYRLISDKVKEIIENEG